ncbi:MAG: DUF4118 domain-containing protein [Acidimicrobiales bacterium]
MRWLASVVAAIVVPFGIALAWVPIRSALPNVDLALILVIAVVGIGALGRRSGVVLGALLASLWFEYFDTAPFGQLAIARNPDIETTLVLALVAVIVGELAVRTVRHRGYLRDESADLSSIASTAALVASGEELVHVIESVVRELTRLLSLRSCSFESDEPLSSRPRLTRTGELVRTSRPVEVATLDDVFEVELPVSVFGEEVGHFVLGFAGLDDRTLPTRAQVLVGVTLADNVGAAFLAQAPPPIPPDRQPGLRLRVVTPGTPAVAKEVPIGEGQQTAGRSSGHTPAASARASARRAAGVESAAS